MSTQLETRPNEATQPTTGNGEVAHIVDNKNDARDAAYIQGTKVEALCGERFVPKKTVVGKPVCRPCLAVYDDDEAMRLANPNPSGQPLSGEIENHTA